MAAPAKFLFDMDFGVPDKKRERAAHEEKAKLAKLLTDQKAARDARYAARKKRQK